MFNYLSGTRITLTILIVTAFSGFYFLHSLTAGSHTEFTGETDYSYMIADHHDVHGFSRPASGLENPVILSIINLINPYLKNSNTRYQTLSGEEYYNGYYSLPMIFPVPGNFRVSSGFGMRRDPFTGQRAFHNGIDIPLRAGTPVRATGNGYCSRTGVDSLLGKYVIINHNDEYESIYGHLSTVKIKAGNKVNSGDIIGTSGNTGRSTNPHLHYQVNHRGKPVDPVKLKEELHDRRWVVLND
jgi:murein DD-endopeptidase MepM/ murein hydrolase activator NlpD